MLTLIALLAAAAAERHPAPTILLPEGQSRTEWSAPVQAGPDAAPLPPTENYQRNPSYTRAPAPPPQDVPPEVARSSGPRATSGTQDYDSVVHAGMFDGRGEDQKYDRATATIASPDLPVGSFAELTALDSGRTIVALVVANGIRDGRVALSPETAQALGAGPDAGIRVRGAIPSPQEQNALLSGGPAPARIDAPEALLVALRKRLSVAGARTPVRPKPLPATRPQPQPRPVATRPGAPYALPDGDAPPPPPPARPSVRQSAPIRTPQPAAGGFLVQVAALSSAARAQTVARSLGGRVLPGGNLYRIQLGPFDAGSAKRARDDAARRGYPDARVIRAN
ncbi:SPOR domain-containing protein [Sphingomonas immobilis]|uniref:SPOR domain-containing protein n=1 Tax=Sphingomonas immobilis TaxID=3063997 RepID=A0ABT8ZZI5_9SPHN|nr:SPOR domain-containing protein [Sphingomonas sp. CA1-15]MDO7842703.1 SPOR domain-containing protein [Sphingomonas sp. CA1-15]